jgi:translin
LKKLKKIDEIFHDLIKYLDGMDNIREKILPLQRKSVRICSEIIKNIHRKDFTTIPTKITDAKSSLNEMIQLIDNAPGNLPRDYLQIVQQELGEAIIFYNLIINDDFPTIEECGIDLVSYAYALTDVVGELRRYVLNCIRKEDLDNANRGLNLMNEIHDQLFSLDYPNGLIPGLRKKIDQARNILARTEGDVSVSINIIKLNSNLKKQ